MEIGTAIVTVEEFTCHLKMVKRNGDGWTATCPAHDDNAPSLSINQGDDGRVLVHCHAGCSIEEIVEAIGISVSDLFAEETSITPRILVGKNGSVTAATMPLIDPSEIDRMHEALTPTQRGFLRDARCISDEVIDRYQIGVTMKFDDPRVTIPIPNPKGEFEDVRCWLHPKRRSEATAKILHWEKGYGSARLFPIDMLQQVELVLVAGELDALALISHGIPSITATAGESTWPGALSRQIASSSVTSVIVVPDNDETGAKGAHLRAGSLHTHGLAVRVASWE
jgi:hypothetical protein